jgi:hypothetical protein
MLHSSIFLGTSSVVRVAGLTTREGTPIPNATVRVMSVVDKFGNSISGPTYPVTLAPLGGGDYEVEIPPLTVNPDRIYTMTVQVQSGVSVREFQETLIAQRARA